MYDEAIKTSFKNFRPNVLAQYLLDLCRDFNHFYQTQKILEGDFDLMISRLTLVVILKDVLKSGLGVLGIEAPEQM